MNPLTSIVVRKPRHKRSSTDIALLVDGSTTEEHLQWERSKISQALQVEAGLSPDVADDISKTVETRIFNSGLRRIDTALIRSLVDNELFERGMTVKLKQQAIIGIPRHDLEQLIFHKSDENANVSMNNPEAVALAITEVILKQYSLQGVFSRTVTDAHLTGQVYIHDLGYPIRVYCSGHSLEYLKMYGLRLDTLDTVSRPAKHARTLTGHLNTFLAAMQAYYAGALGVGAVNVFYAPYLVGMSDSDIKQEAQHLIYSVSQSAFSRGGQTLFTDFNVHFGVPDYLKTVPAVGPGGKYTGKLYQDYEPEALRFCKAMLDVWREGDANGSIMAFPKADLHIDRSVFTDPVKHELFMYACQIASENGVPYFIFDRDAVTVATCCRMITALTDPFLLAHPEAQRFCGVQNVTVNLPQAAYRAKGDFGAFYQELDKTLDVVFMAHIEKKSFLKRIMAKGGPLWQIGKPAMDGRPYVDLDSSSYIVGLIGLNECVQRLTGSELHNNDETLLLGLEIISYMLERCKEAGKQHDMAFKLEESPAESATRRLAMLDYRNFPDARDFVQGTESDDNLHYTNSIHIRADAPVDLITRIRKQSMFHPLIHAGAIIHAFVGESKPSPNSIAKLIEVTLNQTSAAQLTISPEFTACGSCRRLTRGLHDTCGACGSTDVDGITRIVGYFSRVKNWNRSKRHGELIARHAGDYQVGV